MMTADGTTADGTGDGTTGDGTSADVANDLEPGADLGAADLSEVPDSQTPAIWKPTTGTSWQWQLTGTLDGSIDVAVYDIDLFDHDAATIAALQTAGRRVICYFSAGSYEDWRPDKDAFPSSVVGKPLVGWDGEWWLDVRAEEVRAAMKKRLDLAREKGCNAVEPDNVDVHQNDNGFGLTRDDLLSYNRFLVAEAHARGLSIGLKNALDLAAELEPEYDWALNEECLAYDECTLLKPFITANKAVFHVEYVDAPADAPAKKSAVCGDPTIVGFSTLIKTWELDAFRLSCD
ncbi:MAG: endo alpha-1,4 polygalactosaminidase [Myxococcales bacterium]|nr:endo alpha-1,4 polygalactosaminidase [Myxococcales bacterium]